MTRLRTDQACLEAQMQQQIAQGLNAELAVPCPDCGVESGRACRDSLDRAVRTHLARSVAANRRDTEPCPAPDAEEWLNRELDERGVGYRNIERDLCGDFLIVRHGAFYARVSGKELAARTLSPGTVSCSNCHRYWTEESWMCSRQVDTSWPPRCLSCLQTQTESLERASARAFAESLRAEVDRANATCVCCLKSPGADGVIAHRPLCFYKTPTASDCAPSPAASAPDADCNGVAPSRVDSGRPVCACGQTIWTADRFCCSDCASQCFGANMPGQPLDQRIAETKSDDATECAWSTPTSDGEGWR